MRMGWHNIRLGSTGRLFLDEVVEAADTLLGSHPESDYISIGQSPAWLCRTAMLIDQARGGVSAFTLVPFSSHFSETDKEHTENVDGKVIKSFTIRQPKNLERYRRHLEKRGLSPKNLVNNFKQTGREQVFMDYTKNGRGVASFMHLMLAWAKEQGDDVFQDFVAASRVHALVEYGGLDGMRFPDMGVTLPMCRQKVSEMFTHYFADGDNLNATDRLVDYYPEAKWNQPPSSARQRDIATDIHAAIGSAVQEYESRQPPRRRPAPRGGQVDVSTTAFTGSK